MACRHAKGGICTSLACPRAGAEAHGHGSPCADCGFSEEPGERRAARPAKKQLAVEVYSGPIPDGAVRCKRCGRPCRTGAPDAKARMLRVSAKGGYCLDCAVTDWMRNTYPVNLLVGAAPLLGTEAARRDQEAWGEHWDDVDDWGGHGMLDRLTVTEQDPLGKATLAALHGDMAPLDALVAEKDAREARREQRRRERADQQPERKLLISAIREQFASIMQAAFAQARLEDIDWDWIVAHWSLSFPKARGNQGACRP